jgi:hypothetical protein
MTIPVSIAPHVMFVRLYRGQICPPSYFHCTHVSYANVLNESWGQVAALVDLFKKLEQDAIELCVFEATLASPGQWGTDGEGDDNIVGVLLLAKVKRSLSVYLKVELTLRNPIAIARNSGGRQRGIDMERLTSCPKA